MTRNELKQLMEQLGIAPNKKLGQNFLVDEQFIQLILREANPQPGENILEIGPGFGAITRGLVSSGANVTAIEFDRKLGEYLMNAVVPLGVNLIQADACKVDYVKLFQGKEFRLVSNLPYSAGSVILAKLLDLETLPTSMFLMLQKEVVERLIAKPGSDDYASLSIRVGASYQGYIVRNVPPEVFFPVPGVDSTLLFLKRKKEVPVWQTRQVLSRLTKAAFAHRRKKMFRQIAALYGDDPVRHAMCVAEVDPDIRAERVTVPQFIRMAEELGGLS